MQADAAISVQGLSYRYGRKDAVHGLDLSVPRGSVTAFLGPNGAGKTTTIQLLLGLLPMQQGTARVLGLDARRDFVAIRGRVGYVAEEKPLYGWMRVDRLLKFCSAFYRSWDWSEVDRLVEKLGLPRREKIKNLSRGMRGQLSLVLALAHRPALLVLDEPTAGLDLEVRRDFLEGVIELIQEEGRTVFFSSHQIEDVERVADRAVFLAGGRKTAEGSLDTLRERVRRVRLVLAGGQETTPAPPPGWTPSGRSGRALEFIADPFRSADLDAFARTLALAGEPVVEALALEDLYFHFVSGVKPAGGTSALPGKTAA